MNKIYALKYCHVTKTIKVVSELARRVCRKSVSGKKKLCLPASFTIIMISPFAIASVVNGNIPYQTYRDFAENKGTFQAGNTDIIIEDKNGNVTGVLNSAPVPDFSSTDTSGVATLVSPQYLSGVRHNGGYTGVRFGDGENLYHLVSRNNASDMDIHTPRLDKLVTEVVPLGAASTDASFNHSSQYSAFYRLGSGSQLIKSDDGKNISITGAYQYLTGGTVSGLSYYSWFGGTLMASTADLTSAQGVLPAHTQGGDSGSPLYAYDKAQGKWALVANLSSGSGKNALWSVVSASRIQNIMDAYSDGLVNYDYTSPENIIWSFDASEGVGSLSQGNQSHTMHGKKGNDLNAGKDLSFSGHNGVIDIRDDVSQGAGSLTFHDDYTVTTTNGSTWTGAGIIVDQNTSVNWQVNGVKGDNLHKIGQGTLIVQGTGVNEGGLKVGDGTVILNQQADSSGQVQAFSSVNIASGRPIVVLADNRQVNPDNISWGYRGGILNVNGNDLSFHNIIAADYGAQLHNSSDKEATVSLTIPDAIEWNEKDTQRISGQVYKYFNPESQTTEFFVLKTTSAEWNPYPEEKRLPAIFRGANYFSSLEEANREASANRQLIYHGKLTGNISFDAGRVGKFVMDGSADIRGTFSKEDGRLTMQGHPVIHAFNTQTIADKVAATGDFSVLTQPTYFTQDDWENRTFSLGDLGLKNTDFGLGRNAVLSTHIQADNSRITLGDSRVFIDRNDGNGTAFKLEEGTSVAVKDADKSVFNGTVSLTNHSVLNINEFFNGGIQADNSTVNISSSDAVLDSSTLTGTALNLSEGADVLVRQKIISDGAVNIADAALSLNSRSGEFSRTLLPLYSYAGAWNLTGDNASLYAGPFTLLSGDITVQGKGRVTIGGEGELDPDLPLQDRMFYSVFNGYRNVWGGRLDAPDGNISMTDSQWSVKGNSTAGHLKLKRTMVGFGGDTSSFTTLTTGSLDAVQTSFAMRTDLKNADRLVITDSATGHDNSILVNFQKKPSDKDSLSIPLVSAPKTAADDLFRASTQVVGFSNVTPTISVREDDDKKEWVLDGYQVARNDGQSRAAATFMHISYSSFITEVNNLNKRMGDLRNINTEAGSWVRLMNGSGSGEDGFSDRYVLLQMGADRKHELDKLNLFTGVMATYTDTDVSAGMFSGETKSWGAGIYASGLFPSGAYFDLIAKYIHNENRYELNFAGAGKQNFRTHSLYAGAEVGYRYHLTETTFVEPQAELVWGKLQEQTFNWNDGGVDVSMRRDSVSPLVGRTGVVSGKTFRGKDWSLTARAGLHYEFDLTESADIHLQDTAGEHHINGGKDSRMLYGVGVNARLSDNIRFGLEAERSAFGKYNVDNMINASIRYSF